MIVKNESAVIARALKSVLPIIDTWVICDTGSDDGTQQLVQDILSDIPGRLEEVPWVNFGHNRTQMMQFAKGAADYVLMIDADMVANFSAEFDKVLQADSYLLQYEGGVDYWQPMLFSNEHNWEFVGSTHEFAYAETATTSEKLRSLTLTHLADGENRKEKVTRDIALLVQALKDDPEDARAMFYLAQTYFDAEEFGQAQTWYRNRIVTGGWDEEVWYCKFRLAVIAEIQAQPWALVMGAYLEAFSFRPNRLEAIYPVVRKLRLEGDYALGYLLSRSIEVFEYPDDLLFIDRSIYDFKLKFEFAICAFYVGNHDEAIKAYNQLLEFGGLPASYFESCLANRKFSLDAVRRIPALTHEPKENRIAVIVPFFNAGNYLDNCVSSLLQQDHENFEVIFVDDASTDGAPDCIPLDDKRFRLLRREQRVGGAKNLHWALTQIEDPMTIAVFLDGDDWFACNDALSHINTCYNENDCWVLYGQFRYTDGSYGMCKPYASAQQFENARQVWYSSAPRSFRLELYKEALRQDPECLFMKDSNGDWFTAAMDMALMYPILEIAGFENTYYNDRVLYIYNTQNPLNVHKERRKEELSANLEIINKPRFAQRHSLLD